MVEIGAGEFIAGAKLVRMQQSLPDLVRRISFGGLNYRSKSWEALTLDDARYTSVRVALQLVDRSGPVNDEQLRAFGEEAKNTASEMSAIAELPEVAPALEQAVALDEFCADVDVVVGIHGIRAQLRAIYAAMEHRGIEAGSPLALRLFS